MINCCIFFFPINKKKKLTFSKNGQWQIRLLKNSLIQQKKIQKKNRKYAKTKKKTEQTFFII